MNNIAEQELFAESLAKRPLTPKELLEIVVFAVEENGGSCPAYIPMFLKGLWPASEKLSLLGIFTGPEGESNLSKALKSGFDDKSLEGREDTAWMKIHISDSAKGKISIRMKEILTPKGQMAFKEAAAAVKKVWAEQAI